MEEEKKKRNNLRSIVNVVDVFLFTLRNLSVEPVIFLIFLAWTFGSTLRSTGIYRRLKFWSQNTKNITTNNNTFSVTFVFVFFFVSVVK